MLLAILGTVSSRLLGPEIGVMPSADDNFVLAAGNDVLGVRASAQICGLGTQAKRIMRESLSNKRASFPNWAQCAAAFRPAGPESQIENTWIDISSGVAVTVSAQADRHKAADTTAKGMRHFLIASTLHQTLASFSSSALDGRHPQQLKQLDGQMDGGRRPAGVGCPGHRSRRRTRL